MRALGLAIGGACLASLAIFAAGSATTAGAPLIASQAVSGVAPNAGPSSGGQSIVISGTGFTGASDVFFGATDVNTTPCSGPGACFSVPSDTEIDATTPAGAPGTVDITVKAGGVTSSMTPADKYTFQQPAPAVTGVSPSTGPEAGGSPQITITGTDFSGSGFSATDLKFNGTDVSVAATFPCSGSSGGCFQVNSPTSISAYPPAGSGQVDITVTTASTDGTSVQTSTTAAADTYAYAPTPSITKVAPSAGSVNGGNTVVISGTSFESSYGTGANFAATELLVGATPVTVTPCPGTPSAPCFNVDSASQISVEDFPPHAIGAVDLFVTTPGGTSSQSSNDQYTYVPLPTVTGVSPPAGPVAGGAHPATVTGTGFTGATVVTVGPNDIPTSPCPPSPTSPCFTVGGDTQITIGYFPSQTAGTFDITVTTPNGTSLPNPPGDTYAYAPVPTVTKLSPNAGATAGGNLVTVTGTGFESSSNYSTTSVMIGPTPCAVTTCYTVDSSTQITIPSMPPDSAGGMVPITVTTVGGTSAAVVYTYVAGLATVTSISPANGPVSGKANMIITGTNFGTQGSGFAPTDVFFENTDVTTTPCPTNPTAACFNAVSSTKISVFTPAASAAGPVPVSVKTPASSSSSNSVPYTYVAPGAYTALTPFRICDTRPVAPGIAANQCNAAGHGRLGPPINVQVSGGQVPSHAQAVVVNLTAINRTSSGTYVSAYPAGGTQPVASNINLDGSAIHANLAIVALSSSGAITVFNAVGTVDVIVDVEGYFAAPGGSTSLGAFHSLAPVRICDTRAATTGVAVNQCDGTGATAHPIGPGGVLTFNVSSSGSPIPTSGVTAVVFNLTAIAPTVGTVLTAYPGPGSHPTASNLNVNAKAIVPNRVIVPVQSGCSPTCTVNIWNSVGSVNVAVDVNGWFGTSGAPPGAFFYAISPTRICDTRANTHTECAGALNNPLTGASVRTIPVDGTVAVPVFAGATKPVAVVANLTGVLGSAPTFFELYPSDAAHPPGTSDLNTSANDVVANLAVFGLSTTSGTGFGPGEANLYNSVGTINVVLDIAGWFQ